MLCHIFGGDSDEMLYIGIYWIVFVHCHCSFERPLREILTDLQKMCTVEHNSRIFFFKDICFFRMFFLNSS